MKIFKADCLCCWILLATCVPGAPAFASEQAASARYLNISGVDLELSAVGLVPQGILIADDELVGATLFIPRPALDPAHDPLRASVVKMQRRRGDSEPNSRLPRLFAVQDLEGIATSSDGLTVYLVGSHAPTKKKKHRRTDREFLVKARWQFDESDNEANLRVDLAEPGGVHGIYRRLVDDLNGQVKHKGPGGFNVEGLALRDGTLHIGLRAPLSGGKTGNALVFSVPEKALFGEGSERFNGPFARLELDLSGAGVRGLFWDAATDRLLILSGPSAGKGDAPRALWSFDFSSQALTMEHEFSPGQVRELGNPEGVARLDAQRLIIVFDQDEAAQASIMLMAWP